MRKVPVLTAVGLATVLGMFVAPAGAATLFGSDTPGVILAPGSDGSGVFNLNDFFGSTTGPISFEAVNATVDAEGNVSVASDASAVATFTATAGGESVSVESVVTVADFVVGGAPTLDNNNRLVGVPGGNPFVNAIVPGSTVNSVEPLTGLPEAGAGETPGAITGAAVLGTVIAQLDLGLAPTGLRQRNVSVLASGVGSSSSNGLTATLNADGSYSLASDDSFAGAFIVGLSASDGVSEDVVSLLAAEAADVDLSSPLVLAPAGFTAGTYADGVVTAAPNTGALVVSTVPVAVGGLVTVSLNYNASSVDGVNIAVIGFDGVVDFVAVNYQNAGGAHLEAGVTKNLAVSFMSHSGNIQAGFQVFNGGSADVTVSISDVQVIKAGPVTDYALNANSVALSDSDDDPAGLLVDVLGAGASGPAASTDNNFEAGAGSLALNGAGGLANMWQQVSLGSGTFAVEAYVKRVGDADAGSALFVVADDGAGISAYQTVPGASVSADSWTKVTVATTASTSVAPFVVVQAAGLNVVVDDVVVRTVTDGDNLVDDQLLG